MKRYRFAVLALFVALLPALAACDSAETGADDSIAGTWTSRQAADGITADFILRLQGESNLNGSWDTVVEGTSLLGGPLSGTYTHPNVSVSLVVLGFEGDPMTGTVNAARDRMTMRDSDGQTLTFTR